MNKEEFNYMSKSLISSYEALSSVKDIHSVYYLKGIITTLEDLLYKYADDSMLDKLNHMIISSKCVY